MLYNIQDCGYDGGDCCPCTCLGRWDREKDSDYACGSSGYHCLDPTAPCLAEHETALRELQSGSDAATGSTYTDDGSNTGEGSYASEGSYTDEGSNTGEGSYASEGSYTDEGSNTGEGSSTDSRSPTSAPTGAPTLFSNQDVVDAFSTAADGLSGSAVGAIVGVCLVVVLVGGAIYLYKKKQGGSGGGGSNAPNYAAADSASLT
ncbi:conserved unknown protein [Ectocarpus siliculosus]|uniref:LNR domain-containing protein n=1 Tax=Ectocarpus siliculosus TaxID=2880 RepID=D8LAT2_ECTSI|nr:conserved unknown protein [Ectocarpus siliculosus]|eukprot:CBN76441.1 conserved unknown protein [Ectocarpus siliculosus]